MEKTKLSNAKERFYKLVMQKYGYPRYKAREFKGIGYIVEVYRSDKLFIKNAVTGATEDELKAWIKKRTSELMKWKP